MAAYKATPKALLHCTCGRVLVGTCGRVLVGTCGRVLVGTNGLFFVKLKVQCGGWDLFTNSTCATIAFSETGIRELTVSKDWFCILACAIKACVHVLLFCSEGKTYIFQ